MSIFNRPVKRSNWRNEFPVGSLRSVEEVLDLVIEARKTKRAIRFYTVNQGGYLSIFLITSKTKLYRPGGKHPDPFMSIDNMNHVLYPVFKDHKSLGYKETNRRYHKSDELLESYIPTLSKFEATEHRMFTSRIAAEKYSKALSSDPIYMNEVKEWHAYCARIFRHDY